MAGLHPNLSRSVRFSNRPFEVKHFLTEFPPYQRRCRPRARASLRNRHQGPSSMGFEDEAEQSLGRPCRLTDSGSKRTYELTSSIVPRGTLCPPRPTAPVPYMLAAAEAADAQEDETFGKDKRGDELPDWVGDKQKRLAESQQGQGGVEAQGELAGGGG